jgi:hypothetical protein
MLYRYLGSTFVLAAASLLGCSAMSTTGGATEDATVFTEATVHFFDPSPGQVSERLVHLSGSEAQRLNSIFVKSGTADPSGLWRARAAIVFSGAHGGTKHIYVDRRLSAWCDGADGDWMLDEQGHQVLLSLFQSSK